MDKDEQTQPEADLAKRERYAYEHRRTGRFIFAQENTWAAHAQRIKTKEFGIGFNPQAYQYFDGIIASKLNLPALTDEKNPEYPRYFALRDNIAVLRNYILTHYEDTGQLTKENISDAMERIESIAESLGQALANDGWVSRPLTVAASLDVANIDGVGAMEMYKHLLEIQEHPTAHPALVERMKNLKAFFNLPDRDWKLPELNDSPFSPANLAAPPPGYVGTMYQKPDTSGNADTDADSRQQNQGEKNTKLDDAIAQSEQAVKTANALYSVDQMAEKPRSESVEEARKILRLLRNLQFSDRNMAEFLDHGTATTVAAKRQAFSRLIDIFAAHHSSATRHDPAASRDAAIVQGRDTVATAALELAEHTRRVLLAEETRMEEFQRHQLEEKLNHLIDSLPPEADLRTEQPVTRLLETLDVALRHMSGQELDLTDQERLILAAQRVHEAATQLLSADSMQPHTREESLDHAREVLQRINDIVPHGQSMAEFIEHSSTSQKAQFAKQVDELTDTYRNVMAEAMSHNPDIILDDKVREANDAVGGLSHSVKLMAIKEIPNSIAAAQQISADITRDPERWKDLHHRAVDRIVHSAEGGLEKAIGELTSDDEEERDAEIAQETLDLALQHLDTSKRKKKRRSEGKGTSRSLKKQLKKILDLAADDRILKQGRFSNRGDDDKYVAGMDVAMAQARKQEKDQTKKLVDMRADDRIMGQGRFTNDEDHAKVKERPQDKISKMKLRAAQQKIADQTRSTTAVQQPQQREERPAQSTQQAAVGSSMSLSAKDMAAIQQLGSSLKNLENQARNPQQTPPAAPTLPGAEQPAAENVKGADPRNKGNTLKF